MKCRPSQGSGPDKQSQNESNKRGRNFYLEHWHGIMTRWAECIGEPRGLNRKVQGFSSPATIRQIRQIRQIKNPIEIRSPREPALIPFYRFKNSVDGWIVAMRHKILFSP